MAFKDAGKQGDVRDTLYFNAFTEDLFVWDNDLVGDSDRHLVLNRDSRFFDALNELALDPTIDLYLKRYADFDFDIDYTDLHVSFRKSNAENIKVSRGEQNIFIWCVFMAIAERLLDGHASYASYRYIYVDDPISSLDDNNAKLITPEMKAKVEEAKAAIIEGKIKVVDYMETNSCSF